MDTAAATDTCVAMEGDVRRSTGGWRVTAPSLPMTGPSARMVRGTHEQVGEVGGRPDNYDRFWHLTLQKRDKAVLCDKLE